MTDVAPRRFGDRTATLGVRETVPTVYGMRSEMVPTAGVHLTLCAVLVFLVSCSSGDELECRSANARNLTPDSCSLCSTDSIDFVAFSESACEALAVRRGAGVGDAGGGSPLVAVSEGGVTAVNESVVVVSNKDRDSGARLAYFRDVVPEVGSATLILSSGSNGDEALSIPDVSSHFAFYDAGILVYQECRDRLCTTARGSIVIRRASAPFEILTAFERDGGLVDVRVIQAGVIAVFYAVPQETAYSATVVSLSAGAMTADIEGVLPGSVQIARNGSYFLYRVQRQSDGITRVYVVRSVDFETAQVIAASGSLDITHLYERGLVVVAANRVREPVSAQAAVIVLSVERLELTTHAIDEASSNSLATGALVRGDGQVVPYQLADCVQDGEFGCNLRFSGVGESTPFPEFDNVCAVLRSVNGNRLLISESAARGSDCEREPHDVFVVDAEARFEQVADESVVMYASEDFRYLVLRRAGGDFLWQSSDEAPTRLPFRFREFVDEIFDSVIVVGDPAGFTSEGAHMIRFEVSRPDRASCLGEVVEAPGFGFAYLTTGSRGVTFESRSPEGRAQLRIVDGSGKETVDVIDDGSFTNQFSVNDGFSYRTSDSICVRPW